MKALAAGVALVATAGVGAAAQSAKPVPNLDYAKFVGTWYAVSQYPQKAKYPCSGPTTVLYALGDKPGGFQSGSFCSIADGGANDNQASGKLAKSHDGIFTTGLIWPLKSKLLVLAIAPDYSWTVVGSPNHKKLIVLSRTQEIAPAVLDDIKARVAAQGFNTAKLASPPLPSGPPKVSATP